MYLENVIQLYIPCDLDADLTSVIERAGPLCPVSQHSSSRLVLLRYPILGPSLSCVCCLSLQASQPVAIIYCPAVSTGVDLQQYHTALQYFITFLYINNM